jgi:zinc/manganese transport system substrate-binding protein
MITWVADPGEHDDAAPWRTNPLVMSEFAKPQVAACPVVSAIQAAARGGACRRPAGSWQARRGARRAWSLPLLLVVAVLGSSAALAGCGSSQPPVTPGVVRVVAGENFWGNIAAQIGGRHVRVTSIISSPNADPHLYESDVATAIAVAEAGLVIENGAGYDAFVPQLLGATRHPGRIVVSAQRVLGATGPDVNPHFWYDISRVPQVAQAIEAALARLDPRDAPAFAASLAHFDRSLRPAEAVIAEIRRRYPGAPVAYTERVPGYLLQAAGLTVKTPRGFAAAIEDGVDPGPGDTAVMNGLITGHKVKVLLYNAQAVSPVTQHVRSLAQQAGIPVVAVTETMPPSYHSYQAWQLAQAKAILHALGN